MSDSRRFRENEAACEDMARKSPFPSDQEGYRKIAQQWREMAEAAEARERTKKEI